MYYRLIGMGDTACIATLYRQGRMHPEVSSFANRHFYNGQLCPVPLPHQTSTLPYNTYDKASALQALIATHRTAFINCPVPKQEERFKTNSHEAQLCAMVVKTSSSCIVRTESHMMPTKPLASYRLSGDKVPSYGTNSRYLIWKNTHSISVSTP